MYWKMNVSSYLQILQLEQHTRLDILSALFEIVINHRWSLDYFIVDDFSNILNLEPVLKRQR